MAWTFRTIPAPMGNIPCKYQLSIRAPGQQFSEFSTYTFPISPGQLSMGRSSLSSFFDTQGPSSSQGVTRVVDTYGLAPPVYTIEGTTGYDRHLSDGYVLTGLQSMQLLAQFLAQYATLNKQQQEAGYSDTYSLEFYDYFMDQFWVVEPVGPQVFRMGGDRPTLVYYRFRWVAVCPAGVPKAGVIDALAETLLPPIAQAVVNAASTLGGFLVAYGPAGVTADASDYVSNALGLTA